MTSSYNRMESKPPTYAPATNPALMRRALAPRSRTVEGPSRTDGSALLRSHQVSDDPATAGIQIIQVRTLEELADHADSWNKMLEESPTGSPMQSYPQISAYLETQLTPSDNWFCLFAYIQGELIGVLPLILVRSFRLPWYSVCILKTPYDVLHTGSVDCLASPGREDVIEVFVRHLMRSRILPVIRIREIAESSPTLTHLKNPCGALVAVRFHSGAENFIDVPQDFEAYRADFSTNFRRQLKRGGKKFDELPGGQFRCRDLLRTVSENFDRFERVEDAGWKGVSDSSLRAMPANLRLFRLAAERFNRLGWMEWNFLEAGDQTIAAHYAVRKGRVLYLLKIGYDEAFSGCSPGNLLLEKVVESACKSGALDEINCVADCAWHRNWNMKQRLLHDVIILPCLPLVGKWLARFGTSSTCGRIIAKLRRRGSALASPSLTPKPANSYVP